MKLADAMHIALTGLQRDLSAVGLLDALDPTSPDGDPGKFTLAGQPARLVVPRDGHYLNISLDWFAGLDAMAEISGGPVYWYVLILPPPDPHYFVCDWQRMRRWVLDFAAPKGIQHRDHVRWRSDLQRLSGVPGAGLFRWGDEAPAVQLLRPSRIVSLDNGAAAVAAEIERTTGSGSRRAGAGGESQAHLLLKQYVARNPQVVGVSLAATTHLEYSFRTGDRVDMLFDNHVPNRTVVEIEVEGEPELVIGVEQALKYATLAGVEAGYPVVSHRVRPHVVAYKVDYPKVRSLAERYGVGLLAEDPELEVVA